MRRTVLTTLLSIILAVAQQPPAKPPADDGAAKFTSNSQLVIETVTVKDKSGKPIEGLTAKDFIITEDGKPQVVAFCEYQTLKETPDPEPIAPAPPPDASKPGSTNKPDPIFQSQIAPERPGDIRY